MTFPASLRSTWQFHVARTLQTLQTWPWFDTLKTLRHRFREDHLGVTASSLTFTTLIALVPLLTVMLALFSAFPMFSTFQDALQKYFLQMLVPDSIAKPVLSALTQFATKANRIGAVGLGFLLITALALMLTIDRTLNAIWRVRTARPITQRIFVYWAAVTLGPLILGVSLTVTSYAISASKGMVDSLPGGVAFLLGTLEFTTLAMGMAALFHYVPNTQVRWRHALAGGLFVAIGFEVAKRALAWYLKEIPTYAVVYGAFATVPIFLVWIYLGWVIVLLGAVVAAYAPSLQMRIVRHADAPGSRLQLAVAVLRRLARARQAPTHGLSAAELAESLRADPLQIEPLLDALVAMDWIGRLDEGGSARHVMLCDPQTTKAAPLLAELLLMPSPGLRAFWKKAGFGEMTVSELIEE